MTTQELRATLTAGGHHVTPDGRVLPPVAAEVLGCSPGHLANMRTRGTGPPFYKIVGRVWYRVDTLLGWIETCAQLPGDTL